MKRIIALLSAIILALLCFALASCGDHKEAIETVDNTEAIETTAESENVVIASAGTPVYTLIRYIDAYQEEVDLIVAFKNKLIADFGLTFQISADWTMPSSAPPADACEIIIGLTCREESIKTIDEFNLAYGDCAVQICDNNKIVMVAPNYNDLDKCFDYFLNNLPPICVPNFRF